MADFHVNTADERSGSCGAQEERQKLAHNFATQKVIP